MNDPGKVEDVVAVRKSSSEALALRGRARRSPAKHLFSPGFYWAVAAFAALAVALCSLSTSAETSSNAAYEKWKSENKYPRINEFIAALTDADRALVAGLFDGRRVVSSSALFPIIVEDVEASQKTLLSFPFSGEYFVVQGNSSWVSHKKGTSNEYALDLVIQKNGGMVFGNSAKNDKYYAWGQSALAPADGVVYKIRDGNDDHPPLSQKLNDGNFVKIEHENGEISVIYHLMKGSIVVKEGDRVSRGDVIGRVGNSGISVFPHIHYQLDRKGADGKMKYAPMKFPCYFARHKDETEWRLAVNDLPREGEYIMDVASRLDMLNGK